VGNRGGGEARWTVSRPARSAQTFMGQDLRGDGGGCAPGVECRPAAVPLLRRSGAVGDNATGSCGKYPETCLWASSVNVRSACRSPCLEVRCLAGLVLLKTQKQ
jgi:hypothetical protein